MQLAKYVKFREEKFGGVLFETETKSEKVYTLTPTAAAVVQEIVHAFIAELRDKGLVEG